MAHYLKPDYRYIRSANYRDTFLKANPSKNGKYRCVYCGKTIKRKDMVVDHIIPVYAVQTDRSARRALHGKNVNSLSNLAPACSRCNYKKGSEFSKKWIKKAKNGKKESYWVGKKIRKMACVIFIVYIIYLLKYQPETLHKVMFDVYAVIQTCIHQI